MKPKFYFSIIAVAVLISGILFSAFKGSGEWIKFSDKKKAKFEVLLPESPRKDKSKTNWYISATLDEPLTNFYVNVSFYPENLTDDTFKSKAKEWMDTMSKVYNETFPAPAETQFNGSICLEYNYTAMGMKSQKKIFYRGNIMYELTVNPITGDIPKEQAEKFYSSFKFLP